MVNADGQAPLLDVSMTEQEFPRYDPSHGTPDPMVRRVITFRLRKGTARFEQTDYGHPGRFNDWEPRGVDSPLQGHAPQLKAACEALAALL
jgi:hypothetical protein